jgi:chitin disaccharide deacetylase
VKIALARPSFGSGSVAERVTLQVLLEVRACYHSILSESAPLKMKQLILNADDFGLTHGVNEGIIRAHRDGILTSATLMANGLAFDGAVERARANPKFGVGCHLVLVGGTPVAPCEEIPSLVDRKGRFPESLGVFLARLSSGRVSLQQIERELRAQIERIRGAGIEPTHLDTHKHTHAHPQVMEALGRVAHQLGIARVRKPMENLRDSWASSRNERAGLSAQLLAVAALRAMTPAFRAISRKYGLRSPDHFLGLAMTGKLGPVALRHLIDTLPEGRTEIMLHPGICDPELASTGSRLQQERQTELEALLDPGVKRALMNQGIRLISYRELH